jgi:hypothetical protein
LEANYLVLNERLRRLYKPASEQARERLDSRAQKEWEQKLLFASEFQPVQFAREERSGVLTHPYLLSAYAYHNNTSPIHRGVFLTRNIVGRVLNPPPIAVAFKDNDFAADLTMREKITQLTSDSVCMSCHAVINPLGFTLENFDAVGRLRSTDNDKPVDTRTSYTTPTGETLDLSSARDIAEYAVGSEAAHQAFVTQVFQFVAKEPPVGFGAGRIDRLREKFEEDGFHIQHLWATIAAYAAVRGNTEVSPSTDRRAS